jgi:hypothetical protein
MSSLTTTTINTANGTTNLTVATGNTTGPAIVVGSDNSIWIRANSIANVFVTNTTATIINSAATVNSTFIASGNATFNSNVTINSNTTVNRITANTVETVNGSVSTNTFTLGASLVAANGYTRLPNGLLMQWGTQAASVNNATVATVTFPATFSSVYSVQITIANSSTKETALAAVVNAVSTTSFTWKSSLATAAATANIYYLAIGA